MHVSCVYAHVQHAYKYVHVHVHITYMYTGEPGNEVSALPLSYEGSSVVVGQISYMYMYMYIQCSCMVLGDRQADT